MKKGGIMTKRNLCHNKLQYTDNQLFKNMSYIYVYLFGLYLL